jgi:protein associated with RNAse G/E
MSMAGFTPGERIQQRYRKYDGTPHWRFDSAYLGSDEHGIWLGGVPGDVFERPGRRFLADAHYVTLIPEDRFVATFNADSRAVRSRIYIDVMSLPQWQGTLVEAIDLDLDVVRRFTGEVRIEDEDEFAEHQVAFGYPPDLVDSVRRTADQLFEAVRDEREPFGRAGFDWLVQCSELLPRNS